jgi:hypothetical protein
MRFRLQQLISWEDAPALEPGCTALVGMCSRFPDVLLANLTCLNDNAWPELKEVLVVVDNVKGSLPEELEERSVAACTNFAVRIVYYNDVQFKTAERLCHPFVFSWLSWCVGLANCRTVHALLHDYDALVMSDLLAHRYRMFVESGQIIQGLRYLCGPGLLKEDRLVCTTDAFVDVAWMRSFPPIRHFNKTKTYEGRLINYDTTLEVQHNELAFSQRGIVPMTYEDLTHPSQMVCQFTAFRRFPGRALPCFSIPLIPFYEYLSVGTLALSRAISQLRARTSRCFPFLAEGLRVNFQQLSVANVDWCLKQMVQACLGRRIEPFAELFVYGCELYRLVDCPADCAWVGDYSPDQRSWINEAASRASFDHGVARQLSRQSA